MTRSEDKGDARPISHWDQVPRFASESDEAAFWQSNELDERLLQSLVPDADPNLPNPRPRTKPIALRFDEGVIRRAKALALRKGKGYQTLLKEFVSERLYEEEKREGILASPTEGVPHTYLNMRSARAGTANRGATSGRRRVAAKEVAMAGKSGTRKVVRSAATGKFVKKSAAKRSPKTTVTESVRTKKSKGRSK